MGGSPSSGESKTLIGDIRPRGGPSAKRWMRTSTLGRWPNLIKCWIWSCRSALVPHWYSRDASVTIAISSGAVPDREIFDLVPLPGVHAVDPEQVSDVAHLGTFPLIGLKTADLAPPPVEHVTDVVGGVTALDTQLQ